MKYKFPIRLSNFEVVVEPPLGPLEDNPMTNHAFLDEAIQFNKHFNSGVRSHFYDDEHIHLIHVVQEDDYKRGYTRMIVSILHSSNISLKVTHLFLGHKAYSKVLLDHPFECLPLEFQEKMKEDIPNVNDV